MNFLTVFIELYVSPAAFSSPFISKLLIQGINTVYNNSSLFLSVNGSVVKTSM